MRKQTRFNRHTRPEANKAPAPINQAPYVQTSENDIVGNPAFLTGGSAFFTVQSGKDPEKRYTYRLGKKKGDSNSPLFCSVLKGPDNYHNYKYVGIIRDNLPQHVAITAKSQYSDRTDEYKVLSWAIRAIHKGEALPDGYTIQHAGKCCVCARMLTTPDSIKAGIGPTCAAKGGL